MSVGIKNITGFVEAYMSVASYTEDLEVDPADRMERKNRIFKLSGDRAGPCLGRRKYLVFWRDKKNN